MTSYHDLEKSTYEAIVAQRFTPIQDPCTWSDKEQLLQEMCDLAVTYDLHYEWAGEYGALAMVANPARYTADTGLVFVEPEKPPSSHPDAATATAAQAKVFNSLNDQERRSFAIVTGFRRGSSENIQLALPESHYEQLKEDLYAYKRVRPRDYIEHLENDWCPLDEQVVEELKENWRRPWHPDEHITKFAIRLTKEQEKLAHHGITISNGDKKQHYMINIQKSNMFDRPTMATWRKKPSNETTFRRACIYFEEAVKDLEYYERTSSETKGSMGLQGANAATEIAGQLRTVIEERMAAGRVADQTRLTTIAAATEGHGTSIARFETQLATMNATLATIATSIATNSGGGGRARTGAAAAAATAAAATAAATTAAAARRTATAAAAATATPAAATGGTTTGTAPTAASLNLGGWTHHERMFTDRTWPGPKRRWFDVARREYKRDHPDEWRLERIRRAKLMIEELERG